MEIKEAKSLNIGYKTIVKFASAFQGVLSNDNVDLESILISMGAKINLVSSTEFERSESFFSSAGNENFEITVLNDDKIFKRMFLLQALGHYVLHAQRGLVPCKVSSVSKSEASKEAFHFSLALLLKDDVVIKMIEDGFSNKQIANLFRVPEKIVDIKKVILKNNGEI